MFILWVAPGWNTDERHEMKKYNIDRKLNWNVCDGDSMQQKKTNIDNKILSGEKSQLNVDNNTHRQTRMGQSAQVISDRVYCGMCVSQGTTEGDAVACNRNQQEKKIISWPCKTTESDNNVIQKSQINMKWWLGKCNGG